MRTIIQILLFVFSLNSYGANECNPKNLSTEPKRIVWFVGSKVTGFWPMTERFIKAAASDLGVVLEVYETPDPLEYLENAKRVLSRKQNSVDGVLFHNHKHRGEELIKFAQLHSIPVMLFNAGFSSSDALGKPREHYPCWIGSMLPDDEMAGYQLAQSLFNEALKQPNMVIDNELHMVALEGDRASNASALRMKGMKRAIVEWNNVPSNPKVVLNQSFHSKWRKDLASLAFKLTQSRYPKNTVFWTAADAMAKGVIEAAVESGKVPGKDFVVGGVDLLPETFDLLKKGDLTSSVGAHFIEGSFALVALYDYLSGYDFADSGSNEFSTKMAVGEASQSKKLLRGKLLEQKLDSIDFSLLSKAYNNNKPYQFDIQVILDELLVEE